MNTTVCHAFCWPIEVTTRLRLFSEKVLMTGFTFCVGTVRASVLVANFGSFILVKRLFIGCVRHLLHYYVHRMD